MIQIKYRHSELLQQMVAYEFRNLFFKDIFICFNCATLWLFRKRGYLALKQLTFLLPTVADTHSPFSLLSDCMQAACWSLQHSFLAHFITFCPGFRAWAWTTPGCTLDSSFKNWQDPITEIRYMINSEIKKTLCMCPRHLCASLWLGLSCSFFDVAQKTTT